jgi:hypothetical protein
MLQICFGHELASFGQVNDETMAWFQSCRVELHLVRVVLKAVSLVTLKASPPAATKTTPPATPFTMPPLEEAQLVYWFLLVKIRYGGIEVMDPLKRMVLVMAIDLCYGEVKLRVFPEVHQHGRCKLQRNMPSCTFSSQSKSAAPPQPHASYSSISRHDVDLEVVLMLRPSDSQQHFPSGVSSVTALLARM